MQYPKTLTEHETLDLILQGNSIARYGDGEFKLMLGRDCVSQVADPKLRVEMRHILKTGSQRGLIVAIPNMEQTAKEDFWKKFILKPAYIEMLSFNVVYGSSFITRPDSAPDIDTEDYWEKVVSIWKDKDVILVKGSDRSLREDRLPEAKSVTIVHAARRDAYVQADQLENEIMALPHKTVLLCVGATATCLANRLHKKGKHALDLGHIGMFMKHKLKGKYDVRQDS